ncbi:hypothetical protein [Ornithinibacillus sp. 179-J 7C1 HS]|uniref:hypothetical protein n=1 Tax=Ornithinibacillus sp. 179-J 7C1 HS TaxID=3142384 RepID=UPI0039A3AC54
MEQFNGAIFQGEIDQKSFYLTQVKTISTASSLSLDQLVKMVSYLSEQKDSCYITVNDQIPILLQDRDIQSLLADLEDICKRVH